MPSLEEHCQHTLKTYGVEGRDIHEWLDNPVRRFHTGHRLFRHDVETVRLVGRIFGEKYGKSLAENIALDHIIFDFEETLRERRKAFGRRKTINRSYSETFSRGFNKAVKEANKGTNRRDDG